MSAVGDATLRDALRRALARRDFKGAALVVALMKGEVTPAPIVLALLDGKMPRMQTAPRSNVIPLRRRRAR